VLDLDTTIFLSKRLDEEIKTRGISIVDSIVNILSGKLNPNVIAKLFHSWL